MCNPYNEKYHKELIKNNVCDKDNTPTGCDASLIDSQT